VRRSARAWTTAGVECRRDRHRYTGQSYAFTTKIVHVLCCERGRASWEALIVAERWATGVPETVFRHAKWMRLVAGKASDLRAWIRRHRPASLASSTGNAADP